MDLLPSERPVFFEDMPDSSEIDTVDTKDCSNVAITSAVLPTYDSSTTLSADSECLINETFPPLPAETGEVLKKQKTPGRAAETFHIQSEPEHIIEYEWPENSSDFYFIQEQISQLLDVKSFKRKYPDLTRRIIELEERDLLINEKGLNKIIPPHLLNHLTALRSVEVYDLMATEYPTIHIAYQKFVADRLRQSIIDKQKELDLIKSDTKKMEELRKKTMRSAAKFNNSLQTIKKSERKFFYDIQTSIIQSAANRWFRLSAEASRPSPYPLALIPGQYTSHFRKFNSKELNRLPLNSVLENDDLIIPKRERSPTPIRVTDEELAKSLSENVTEIDVDPTLSHSLKEEFDEKSMTNSVKSSRRSSTAINNGALPRKPRKGSISAAVKVLLAGEITPFSSTTFPIPEEDRCCIVCNMREHEIPLQGLAADLQKLAVTPFVKCSECLQEMHTGCIDMPTSMVAAVKKYNWRCAECKECTICTKPDQEDAMMCCDFCDRGYHTFCIGLVAPLAGPFICVKCEK